jgi:hypothetical protein
MQVSTFPRLVRAFIREERRNLARYDVPLWRRLWLYRHGLLSSRDELWDLNRKNIDQYLSDLQWRAAGSINQPYDRGLRNKLFFQYIVATHHEELLPPVHGLVREGRVVPGPFGDDLASLDQLLEFVTEQPLVVKPADKGCGADVHLIDATAGQPALDGQPVTRAELSETLERIADGLLVGYVSQTGYAEEIFPGSTNTIRLVTMVDPATGEPFVADGVHRFGTAASAPRDNVSAGGVCADLDPETGRLGEVIASAPEGYDWRETHPDTGVRITGQSVPEWNRLKDRLLEVAGDYGSMWPYVGWDVAVTDDDGSFTIIEGNRHPELDAEQAFEPLLSDERVRRFYDHHGVL